MSNPDTPAEFTGFTPETVPWFEGLTADNSKAYFEENRPVYERAVRQPMLALASGLAARFGGTVKLFRPYRDARFSLDKAPYKENTGAVLIDHRAGSGALLYVSTSADGLQATTGYYRMAKDQLARYRQTLTALENSLKLGAELNRVLETLQAAGIETDGAPLKGMPRGVAKDAPNADLARYTSLTAGGYLEPERMEGSSALNWVAGIWTSAEPLNKWLDKHVGKSTIPPDRTR